MASPKVNVGVGPMRKFTLYAHKLPGGQEGGDPATGPRVPQAYRWPSIGKTYSLARVGAQQIANDLNGLVNHLGVNGASIAYQALRPTFKLALRYTPVDTKALKKSGKLEIVTRNPKNPVQVAEISFGSGGRPFYTVFVHEITSYAHAAPTQAKFLEVAIKEDFENIRARVERLTRKTVNV